MERLDPRHPSPEPVASGTAPVWAVLGPAAIWGAGLLVVLLLGSSAGPEESPNILSQVEVLLGLGVLLGVPVVLVTTVLAVVVGRRGDPSGRLRRVGVVLGLLAVLVVALVVGGLTQVTAVHTGG